MSSRSNRFPQRLRQARLALGWSQTEMAERCGVEKPRLSRYENGHVAPRITTVEDLAAVLRVKPQWLVGWER